MKFGMKNAPETFQHALHIVLTVYKCKSFLVYLDDIIEFCKDAYSHLKHVEKILSKLHNSNVTIKLNNCALYHIEGPLYRYRNIARAVVNR